MGAAPGFALFETALGVCGVAWNAAERVVGVQLPGADEAASRRRLALRAGAASESPPPPAIAAGVERIRNLLAGGSDDLRSIELDWDGVETFERQVFEATRAVAPGTTTTYGALATALGDPSAARAVGRALARNPFPIVVPCHRVLAADGSLHGFSAPGGLATKRRMLAIERAADPGGQRNLLDDWESRRD
jgi:methylated-DNA-[protein]-cysteine S-methyltransferase